MRKKLNFVIVLIPVMAALFFVGCGKEDRQVLNVYNWGEYIADGSEGYPDVIKNFEKWYEEVYGEKIKVNYSTYPSNEDMYSKIASGAAKYDVIIPSDYMIARMIDEGLLEPLDFKQIPNSQYINEAFTGLYYDKENKYTVPYSYGIVGVIYDSNIVDKEDVGDWDLMWNDKYKDKILQYNNSRDAFGTAMYKLGIDVNTTDKKEWKEAADELDRQKPLVKSYVMDEIFNMMESGEAAIGSYYAGDYLVMKEAEAENVDLQFYYPEKTNFFVDAMCIPTCTQNKELAEIFIDYMLSKDAAIPNAEYISYASPNKLVYEDETYLDDMGDEAIEMLYPEFGNFTRMYNRYAYRTLDTEILDYINTLWEDVKIN